MIGKAIDEDSLRLLLSQHAVTEARITRVEGREGRWCLSVRLGGQASRMILLRSKREPIRSWASLDSLVRFAHSVGLTELVLEL